MLWALLADFRRWGAVHTITSLDPRFEACIPGLNRSTLPAGEIACPLPGRYEDAYGSLLKRCDAVLIVAPETNGILARLTAQAESAGLPLLCCSSRASAVAGNKAVCAKLFRGAQLPCPKTRTASFASAGRIAKQMGYPLVMKPLDGVGCEGVFRITDYAELDGILKMVRYATAHDRVILQSFADGIHASVSLIVSKGRCLPVSLNCQLIEAGSRLQYLGSRVPFDHPARVSALNLAVSAANLIPGLNGYVGVDVVLTGENAWLIEINPRLTTSYIGLRQVAEANMARVIWDACQNGVLPECIPLTGQVVIKKDDPATWGLGN